jgi:hypothetical protein
MEYFDASYNPNMPHLQKIIDDLHELYLYTVASDELLEEIGKYIGNRIDQLIEEGEWRTTFYLPDNRQIAYSGVRLSMDDEGVLKALLCYDEVEPEEGAPYTVVDWKDKR